ncbi:MAG: hypothetical protein A2007_01120 [Verrucomicrobia bacterium GWC2_42_7]|nr:MAG: hypothetical protein A2007_01120 [Verrucomicrobia bacterium GWC2_42_7]
MKKILLLLSLLGLVSSLSGNIFVTVLGVNSAETVCEYPTLDEAIDNAVRFMSQPENRLITLCLSGLDEISHVTDAQRQRVFGIFGSELMETGYLNESGQFVVNCLVASKHLARVAAQAPMGIFTRIKEVNGQRTETTQTVTSAEEGLKLFLADKGISDESIKRLFPH